MIKHIEVTQEHIDNGLTLVGEQCPVFLAIDEVCKNIMFVGYTYIQFLDNKGEDILIEIESDITNWIESFDDGEAVSPFGFDLDIPDALCS